MTAKTPPFRAWQRMLSGRRLDLLDPSPLDVEIEDIALGLSRVARWNGQTAGDFSYSVAQHSLLVEHVVGLMEPGIETRWRLAALLHDAAEYVIGDMISPFKAVVGGDYKAVEKRLAAAIQLRFSLPADLPGEIVDLNKRADRVAAYFEATELAGFAAAEADKFFGRPRGIAGTSGAIATLLAPVPASNAAARFLKRFSELA